MATPSKLRPRQLVQRSAEISNPKQKRLYTLKEAAEYLGRSQWGMRELIWAGEIPVVKREGGRKVFLDILDLMAFIDRNKSTYL